MRILLISPRQRVLGPRTRIAGMVPLGLGYLGSALKEDGHEVVISDMYSYRWAEVESEIKRVAPDIVGISFSTSLRCQGIQTARIAKRCSPEIKVILGGHHASYFPEQMFELAPVDAIVIGEGEITTVELVRALERNGNLSDIRGIAFQKDGAVVKTKARPLIKDLDSLPFPMYDYFDLKRYDMGESPKEYRHLIFTYLIPARGCLFACQFCSAATFWGRVWRAHSVKRVVDELEWLRKEHNVQHFWFPDGTFTLNQERVIEICQEILRRKLDIVWLASTRVDCVSKELLKCMKSAGCYRIHYGVESGNAQILKNITKGFTPDHVRQAFKLTHEVGIEPYASLMVGNPGESNQTIEETVKLWKEITPANSFSGSLTRAYPQTPLYELAKTKGILSDEYWLTDKPVPCYTGDHSLGKLRMLQLRLIWDTTPWAVFIKHLLIRVIIPGVINPKFILSFAAAYLKDLLTSLRIAHH